MKNALHIVLDATPEQMARLQALQVLFAEVCNALAPIVQQTRCWNRVALHHLTYRSLRERYPQLGSQMVCNAIYSVSRTCRLVLQHPDSPFNVAKRGDAPLPLLRFLPTAPVYFDRHTLSLKGSLLSLYTLDGRMRFQVSLKPEDEERFHTEKLAEVILSRRGERYQLSFRFAEDAEAALPGSGEFPEYLMVLAPPETPESVVTPAPDTCVL